VEEVLVVRVEDIAICYWPGISTCSYPGDYKDLAPARHWTEAGDRAAAKADR
jgi:hypothetical protein